MATLNCKRYIGSTSPRYTTNSLPWLWLWLG